MLQSQHRKHVNTEMNNLLAEKSTSSRTTATRPCRVRTRPTEVTHFLSWSHTIRVFMKTTLVKGFKGEEEEGASAACEKAGETRLDLARSELTPPCRLLVFDSSHSCTLLSYLDIFIGLALRTNACHEFHAASPAGRQCPTQRCKGRRLPVSQASRAFAIVSLYAVTQPESLLQELCRSR